MRGKKAWLNMLALFAFVLAQLPTSALASLFIHSDCTMPCCSAEAVKRVGQNDEKKSEGSNHCKSEQNAHPCKTEGSDGPSIATAEKKHCGCEISASSQSEPPIAALPGSQQQSIHQVDLALPCDCVALVLNISSSVEPGIRGSDSGPPVSHPYCVWLGRAPPMFLA